MSLAPDYSRHFIDQAAGLRGGLSRMQAQQLAEQRMQQLRTPSSQLNPAGEQALQRINQARSSFSSPSFQGPADGLASAQQRMASARSQVGSRTPSQLANLSPQAQIAQQQGQQRRTAQQAAYAQQQAQQQAQQRVAGFRENSDQWLGGGGGDVGPNSPNAPGTGISGQTASNIGTALGIGGQVAGIAGNPGLGQALGMAGSVMGTAGKASQATTPAQTAAAFAAPALGIAFGPKGAMIGGLLGQAANPKGFNAKSALTQVAFALAPPAVKALMMTYSLFSKAKATKAAKAATAQAAAQAKGQAFATAHAQAQQDPWGFGGGGGGFGGGVGTDGSGGVGTSGSSSDGFGMGSGIGSAGGIGGVGGPGGMGVGGW